MKYLNNILTIAVVLIAVYLAYDLGFNRTPKFSNGEVAPDFSAATPSGDSIRLSDYKGKYVLLDFWGSWCGPCRAESPGLVYLYQKYHKANFKNADGFEVLSVAMDKDKDRWLRAIQQDGLVWNSHVSDLKRMRGPVGSLYKVREIPTKYLINEAGVIIGVNLSVPEMDKILEKKLQ